MFPFRVQNVWYDRCVSNDGGVTFFCSLDRIFNQRIARCQTACPLLARNLMKNDPSNIHTSCINPNPIAKSLFPNDTQIQTILDLHNQARARVSPTAANMRALTWDTGLARLAQRWAENCIFTHDCFYCRRLVNNQTVPVNVFFIFQ